MSKKMLPTASTLIRACVVGVFGTVITSEPSFGVEAVKTVGKFSPPSVDNEILTFAVLIGAAVVPLTFHDTVCAVPPVYETAAFCVVTRNGVPVLTEVTVIGASTLPPLPSRTVTRNCIARAIDGKSSPVIQVPAQIAPITEVPVKVKGASFELFKI